MASFVLSTHSYNSLEYNTHLFLYFSDGCDDEVCCKGMASISSYPLHKSAYISLSVFSFHKLLQDKTLCCSRVFKVYPAVLKMVFCTVGDIFDGIPPGEDGAVLWSCDGGPGRQAPRSQTLQGTKTSFLFSIYHLFACL